MMTAPRLSVLTCTRNGERTIARALDAVKAQAGLKPGEVEMIVVDNGSTDATPRIIAESLTAAPFPTRFLTATKEGKVNALIAGLEASRGEYVCIVDDDNIICEDFLRVAVDFLDTHPDVGLIGGVNELDGGGAPDWFDGVKDFFACGEPYYITPPQPVDANRSISDFALIAGAGSTFRKTVLTSLMARGFFFLNETFRGAKMAVTGEDREMSVLFHYFGWKMGCDRRMTLRHAVGLQRLTPDYLARLCQSIGAGNEGSNLLEAQREGRLDDWKQHWWWRALRRGKRLGQILPAAIGRSLNGSPINMGYAEWNMEIGGLRRCLKDRDKLLRRARERAQAAWVGAAEACAPGSVPPGR
jgi:glycosyltransferase involved in cell wall biosynthesis